MASLTQVLAAEPLPTLGEGIGEAFKTGVGIAQAKQQMEAQKQQVAVQKEELDKAKMNGLGNRVRAAAFSSDKAIFESRLKQAEAYANQSNIPFNSEAVRNLYNNDQTKLVLQNGISSILSGKTPVNPQEFLGIIGSQEGLYNWGEAGILQNSQAQNKTASAAEIAQIRAAGAAEKAAAAQEAINARQQKNLDKDDKKMLRKEATDLSKDFGKNGLPEVYTAIKEIDKMVGGIYEPQSVKKFDRIAGTSGFTSALKIPFTQIAPLENAALKGDDLKLYQQVAGLRNAYLKLRSGGAVTDPEAERFLAEMGQGGVRTGEQLQNGLQSLTNAVGATVQNIEAGYGEDAVELYGKRNGSISSKGFPKRSGAPVEKAPPAGPAGPKPPTPEQIATFVENAKKAGAKPEDIAAKLKQMGVQ